MLGSIGTKNGIILYHIGYGRVLSCLTIISVTICNQPKCWLISIGLENNSVISSFGWYHRM
jgi:hypothetical protein